MKTIIVNNPGPRGRQGELGPSGSDANIPPLIISSSAQFTDITAPFTGSFTGSFAGDGSNLINVTAPGTLSGSAQIASDISGSLGTNATLIRSLTATGISGSFTSTSSSISTRINSLETKTVYSGSFSGSYEGNGSGLTNIPASGITGLNLSRIANGAYTASISTAGGLNVNTHITASGNISSSGDITAISYTGIFNGALSGSAQIASNISGSLGSNATLIRSLTAAGISGSFVAASSSFSTRVTANETNISSNDTDIASLTRMTGSYATTGSNTFVASQTIQGDLTVAGTGSFDHFTTIYVSSSVIYQSGSTKFGDSMDDTHTFTGSLSITGSATIVGGTYSGDGGGLTNIPASGIVGLNLSQIASGSATASISPNGGLFVNTHITSSGNISSSGEVRGASLYTVGTLTAEHIISTDDMVVTDDLTVNGNISASGNIYGKDFYVGGSQFTDITSFPNHFGIGLNGWGSLVLANITASGNISSSAASTASFGTYLGDGSQLSGISTTPFPFSGSAVITGSLMVSQSVVDFMSASAVLLDIESLPLVNPKVEYFTPTVITSSGTTVPIPGGLTFVSSSTYEYLEIFINGLRLRYDMDFIPASTGSVRYEITVPPGSELTYKSLKRP